MTTTPKPTDAPSSPCGAEGGVRVQALGRGYLFRLTLTEYADDEP